MHPLILHIETSADVCSVALSQGDQCIAIQENSDGRNHASMLSPFIETLLKGRGLVVSDLDAISVSTGPGSYTGLRIGLSTAKGLCYGAEIPMIAVSTLKAMSRGVILQKPEIGRDILLCPMIDARRMEVYTALYDCNGCQLTDISAEIITEQSFVSWLNEHCIYFFGDGAFKCSSVINHPNTLFINDFQHSARFMIPDALQAYHAKHFENAAYFEPFYLKDFIAGKPKKSNIPD